MEGDNSYYVEVAGPLFLVIVGVTVTNCLDKLARQTLVIKSANFVWQQTLLTICLLALSIPIVDFLHDVKCFDFWNGASIFLLFVPLTLYSLSTSIVYSNEHTNQYWQKRKLVYFILTLGAVFFLISQTYFFNLSVWNLDDMSEGWNIYLYVFILFGVLLTTIKNRNVHSILLILCATTVFTYILFFGGLDSMGESYLCNLHETSIKDIIEGDE